MNHSSTNDYEVEMNFIHAFLLESSKKSDLGADISFGIGLATPKNSC